MDIKHRIHPAAIVTPNAMCDSCKTSSFGLYLIFLVGKLNMVYKVNIVKDNPAQKKAMFGVMM